MDQTYRSPEADDTSVAASAAPAPAAGRSGPHLPAVLLAAGLALGAGLAIAWVDSRPGWDDTGVTVAALVAAAGLAALARVPVGWVVLLVSGPLLAAELPRGSGVLLALPIALAAALGGAALRRQAMAG